MIADITLSFTVRAIKLTSSPELMSLSLRPATTLGAYVPHYLETCDWHGICNERVSAARIATREKGKFVTRSLPRRPYRAPFFFRALQSQILGAGHASTGRYPRSDKLLAAMQKVYRVNFASRRELFRKTWIPATRGFPYGRTFSTF